MIEPNCDMPWEIYLDWLQEQGNEDLRFIDPCCFILGCLFVINRNAGEIDGEYSGNGGGAHECFPANCRNLNSLVFGSGCPLLHDFDNGRTGYSGSGDVNCGRGLGCDLTEEIEW